MPQLSGVAAEAALREEVIRYERVRQRLLALLPRLPWLAEVTIAVEGRACRDCRAPTVVEHPPAQFRCRACGATWTLATSLHPRR